LLRHDIVYSDGRAWTGAHDSWLRRQRFTSPAVRMAFESDYDAVLTVKARRDRLDTAITVMAADSEFTPVVRRLGCLRGVSTLTGFALAVEIGDLDKLLRALEFLLAHNATVLTTNYMIRTGDVWVRRDTLVKPVSNNPNACLTDPTGLTGAHKKAYEQVAKQTAQPTTT
jgi:hypothetical protein